MYQYKFGGGVGVLVRKIWNQYQSTVLKTQLDQKTRTFEGRSTTFSGYNLANYIASTNNTLNGSNSGKNLSKLRWALEIKILHVRRNTFHNSCSPTSNLFSNSWLLPVTIWILVEDDVSRIRLNLMTQITLCFQHNKKSSILRILKLKFW